MRQIIRKHFEIGLVVLTSVWMESVQRASVREMIWRYEYIFRTIGVSQIKCGPPVPSSR
jgi:hypothetical protein